MLYLLTTILREEVCNIRGEIITWETGVIKGLYCQRDEHLVTSQKQTNKQTNRVLQYPWANYKSLSEQHYAANLNYAATYKTRTDFGKTRCYSE